MKTGLFRQSIALFCTFFACYGVAATPDDVAGQVWSVEVTIASDVGRDIGLCLLKGMLLVPENAIAIVVMIHGSGANDRNESIPNSDGAPFRYAAKGLAKQGIATLRYDKRNFDPECAEKAKASKLLSPLDYMTDAIRVAEFTRSHRLTRELPLIVLGHSQGVNFAVEIADHVGASGVVLMAGLSVNPIDKTYMRQMRYMATWESLTEEQRQQLRTYIEKLDDFFPRVRAGTAQPDEQYSGWYTKFWRDWIEITDRAEAKTAALAVPGFVIQGSKDWNVTREDFIRFTELLQVKGSDSYLAEDLNHLFIRGEETRVPDEIPERIAAWIKSVVLNPGGKNSSCHSLLNGASSGG